MPNDIGNRLGEIHLWRFAHNLRMHQLFPIGTIEKHLRPERRKKLLRVDKGIRRTAERGPPSHPDQPSCVQPSDQLRADLLTKKVLQCVAGNGLSAVLRHGSQGRGDAQFPLDYRERLFPNLFADGDLPG